MKTLLFSIYDQVTQIYSKPFHSTNVLHAQRLFKNAVQDINSEMNRNPSDYDLVELGSFDDQTGAIEYTPLNRNPLNGGSFPKES